MKKLTDKKLRELIQERNALIEAQLILNEEINRKRRKIYHKHKKQVSRIKNALESINNQLLGA